MINQLLHQKPVPIDRNEHRLLRLKLPMADWSVAAKLNAIFVAAAEFGDVVREYPVVFVRAGTDDDGKPAIAPIAVFGLAQQQNLYVDGDDWRAAYVPAVLRNYPFCIGRLDDERFAVCIDAGWSGLSGTEGEPLFGADGQPTQLLADVQKHLEVLEAEIQRTRVMCRRLRELDLLHDMRFDATLPDGSKLGVDGFLTVDDKKLATLDDAVVVELHKSGLLGLIHAHFISMGNMRRLLDWHVKSLPAAPTPPQG